MFKIVLVGRPNVGKSTLFNRLVGARNAIVNDQPGVTRDRKYGKATLVDLEFTLIDTAGIDDLLKGILDNEIKLQTDIAIDDADLIIFVIDGIFNLIKSFGLICGCAAPVCDLNILFCSNDKNKFI